MPTVLVKNGLVYDGSGEPPKKADILVRRGRIVRLGSFPKKEADVLLDAAGGIVVPGFIDINSDFDHRLEILNDPTGEKLVMAGITTVLGGNCGSSLFPVFGISMLSLRKWGDISKINVGWRGISDFLKTIERRSLGVNFGTLVGHGTVRRGLLGEDARDLTDRETAAMIKIVEESLVQGAFGISFGLDYAHAKMTPFKEISELCRLAAAKNRVVSIHLRDYTEGLIPAVEETIKLGKETEAKVEISHLEPVLGFRNNYVRAKETIEAETAGTHVHFDCNIEGVIKIPIYQLLPPTVKRGNLDTMNDSLRESRLEKGILDHLKKVSVDEIIIFSAPPPLGFLNGRTLDDFAISHELRKEEAILRLMRLSHLRAVVLLRNVDDKMAAEFAASPSSFVSSGATGKYEAFTNFLRAASGIGIPLEKAVQKATGGPAEKFGIKNRGLIKENYFADLVVLRDFKPRDVVINGKVALMDGNFKPVASGSVLRAG
ncbi:MAG TPA: amidohydrolase family protein [Candidatus Paceibacterota bacterium]|nr:amidohydrolase family protein [Candidatus Paceibacterota bacterium]